MVAMSRYVKMSRYFMEPISSSFPLNPWAPIDFSTAETMIYTSGRRGMNLQKYDVGPVGWCV